MLNQLLYWITSFGPADLSTACCHQKCPRQPLLVHQTCTANWPWNRIKWLQGNQIKPDHTSKLRISDAPKHQLSNREWHFIITSSVWGHNMEQLAHIPYPLGLAVTSFLSDQKFQNSSFCQPLWAGWNQMKSQNLYIYCRLTSCWQFTRCVACLPSQQAVRGD